MNRVYRWMATSPTGQRTGGVLAAGSEAEARRLIRQRGLTPAGCDLDIGATLWAWVVPETLTARALADVFSFLGDSTALELPLGEMLRSAERSAADDRVRQHLGRVRARLAKGASLADAIEQATGMPPFVVHVLRTAELSGAPGALAEAFASLREHYRLQADFATALRKALMQPLITGAVVLAVAAFMVFGLVPRLKPLFQLYRNLPWYSTLVLSFADWASAQRGPALLGAAALGLGLWVGRAQVARALPGVRSLLAAIEGFQMCSTLAVLLRARFPATRALTVAASGLRGPLRARMERAAAQVGQGVPLSTALAGAALSAEVLQTIRRGEQLGQVAEHTERAASYYKRTMDARFATLSQTLGLTLTVAGAAVLAIVAFTVFLPFYSGLGSLSLGGR